MEKRRNCCEGAISPLFDNIFNISLTSDIKLHIHFGNVVVRFMFFLNSANLICRGMDILKYFKESLGLRDYKSRLYLYYKLPNTASCCPIVTAPCSYWWRTVDKTHICLCQVHTGRIDSLGKTLHSS